jgi:Zn-finger nucleic acid-binding protein
MFDCPYCHIPFTTKQRLISHLTRNNKCYDVDSIGVPPILLELMGFQPNVKMPQTCTRVQNHDKESDYDHPSQLTENPITNLIEDSIKHEHHPVSDKHCLSNNDNSMEEVIYSNKCPKCCKVFASKKNLDKHISNDKCNIKTPTHTADNTNSNHSEINTTHSKNTIHTADNTNSNHSEITTTHSKNTIHTLEVPRHSTETHHNNEPHYKPNIKYIIRENYIEYLTRTMGSADVAYKYVRACIQNKIKGAINLLHKIYFEGRKYIDYPIEISTSKNKKLYYKTPYDIVPDENCNYIKSILIENIRNCYLQFCNHIISSNLGDNDIIFDDYDLAHIQKHIIELAEEKKKDKIITGLLDKLKVNV